MTSCNLSRYGQTNGQSTSSPVLLVSLDYSFGFLASRALENFNTKHEPDVSTTHFETNCDCE